MSSAELKPFIVHRPYCSPHSAVVLAESQSAAIEVSHQTFGFASNTSADVLTTKGAFNGTSWVAAVGRKRG